MLCVNTLPLALLFEMCDDAYICAKNNLAYVFIEREYINRTTKMYISVRKKLATSI